MRSFFIQLLRKLTEDLKVTYSACNDSFSYQDSLAPRRILTKPSEPAENDGQDNAESNLIVHVNDKLGDKLI